MIKAAHMGRTACLAAVLGVLANCRTAPPQVDPGGAIASALDVREAIVFRTEGGPVDEGPHSGPESPNDRRLGTPISPANGVPFEASDALTLAEAMRRAVTTDPSIQAALARVRIALADARHARLWPNPILNLALRWPESGGSPIVEASLAQDLVSILTTPRRSSAADNRLRQAAADAVTVALDVAAELQERYASVQALDELMPVLHQRRDPLTRLVDLANVREQGGEGTRQDVTVLEAQRMELEVEIAAVEQEARDQRLQLARLIGEPSSAATWALDAWQPPKHVDAVESSWIAAALQHRPEIQSITWRLAALGDDLALTRLLAWEGTSAGAQAERAEGDWSVGPEVSLPLPLFDTGQARAARVTAEQIEARHDLTKAQRAVVEDVRRAYESLVRSEASLRRVREQLIPLQQQRRAQAEVLFRAGEDLTALFLAEEDLRSAEARAVELERQTTIALVRLQRAVGGAGVADRILPTPIPPEGGARAPIAHDPFKRVMATLSTQHRHSAFRSGESGRRRGDRYRPQIAAHSGGRDAAGRETPVSIGMAPACGLR